MSNIGGFNPFGAAGLGSKPPAKAAPGLSGSSLPTPPAPSGDVFAPSSPLFSGAHLAATQSYPPVHALVRDVSNLSLGQARSALHGTVGSALVDPDMMDQVVAGFGGSAGQETM